MLGFMKKAKPKKKKLYYNINEITGFRKKSEDTDFIYIAL